MSANPQQGSWSAVKIHPSDSVAVALAPLEPGDVRVRDGNVIVSVRIHEPVPLGHKFALAMIAEGAPVLKYGEAIGRATAPIAAGAHVHVHNVRSQRAGASPARS